MSKSVLIIYAHPTPYRSKVNRYLFEAATALDFVTGQDLYELYPNLHVDVAVEQHMLRRHDVLVFQFPLYWYSAPALLKEWMDTVLARGVAHGPGERVLEGKQFMLAVTTGGSSNAYVDGEPHGAPLSAYLAPLEQAARFCGMEVVRPFVIQGAAGVSDDDVRSFRTKFQKRLTDLRG